jgi:hypothetical protein
MIFITVNLEALPEDRAAKIIDPIQPDKVLRLVYARHKQGKRTFVYDGKTYTFNYNYDVKFVKYSDVVVCKYNGEKLITTMSYQFFKNHYPNETITNAL